MITLGLVRSGSSCGNVETGLIRSSYGKGGWFDQVTLW